MKSQPQNPEFRNNPENFHPCGKSILVCIGTFCTKKRALVCQKKFFSSFDGSDNLKINHKRLFQICIFQHF